MDNYYEAALTRKFSKIFFDGDGSTIRNFRFECGNGWFGLVGGTLLFIDRRTEELNLDVNIRQVKEKFGQLRVYCRGVDENIRIAVDIAELVSSVVCEVCGGRGTLRKADGWLHVRCDNKCDEDLISVAEIEKYQFSYAVAVMSVISLFGGHSADWLKKNNLAFNNRPVFEFLAHKSGCEQVVVHIGRLAFGVGL